MSEAINVLSEQIHCESTPQPVKAASPIAAGCYEEARSAETAKKIARIFIYGNVHLQYIGAPGITVVQSGA